MAKTSVVLSPKCVAALLVLLLGSAVVSSAQTVAQDRVLGPIDDSYMNVVEGNQLGFARSEFDQGRVDGGMLINRASIVFKPSPAQQRALDTLLAEQQDHSSPNYHKWLTPEQYADRFGMTRSDLAKIASWLQSKGLVVNGTARGRNQIFFTGTAAQIENAFHTEIHHYLVNGETHFANATDPSAPSAFADSVLAFGNLNDFRPKPRSRIVKPHFTDGRGKHFLAPDDFATIYGLHSLYTSGLDGTGQTIAVVGASAITVSDIDAFRSAFNLPKNDPQIIVVPGTGIPTHNDAEVEADLDIEWSGAVAKGANIIYVVVGPSANGGAFAALQYAIDNDVAPVISNSFGLCEAQTDALTAQTLAQRAVVQGQTITSATGDAGAADCDGDSMTPPVIATLGLSVDVPASIPEVTGVGGSEFMGDPQGVNPFWSPNNNPSNGSALMYIPEMAWNDSPTTGTDLSHQLSAGGGGASTVFGKPSFQTMFVPTPGTQRDVPDISLSASADHDGYLICNAGSCTTSFAVVGGTSVGAPTFAGLMAIINQASTPTNSPGQGNVNPTLYSLAKSTPTAFHDITSGSNIVPCTPGTPSTAPAALRCPSAGRFGFSAGTGYDQVTGLGSIVANILVTKWPTFLGTADFAVGGTAVNLSAPGQSGSSTITVQPMNTFSSPTVNLSFTTPCPTAAFITCSLSANSVSLSGSTPATATLSVSTMPPHAAAASSAEIRRPAGLGWFAASGGALLAGFFVMGVPSRRRHWSGLLGILLLTFVAAGISCGGGSSSHTLTGGTPTGTYTVAVTATDGSLSHTTNVAITVQ